MVPLAPRKKMMDHHTSNLLPSTLSKPDNLPVRNNNVSNKSHGTNDTWRRYGIERRRQLLGEDEAEGGNRFELNYECRIQGYFALSEKIIAKFYDSFANGSDLEATYVMGHRLCHFLTEALPRHPAYMKKDPVISRLREKSFQSLVQVKKRIEALALRIDEEELNKYILHDFDPFADDDDDSSTSSSCSDGEHFSSSLDKAPKDDIQWENFDGWSFDLPDKMTQQSAGTVDVSLLTCNGLDASGETEDTSNETFSSSEHSFQASDDFEPIYDSFGLDFLKRIASEEVRYETDSEAADSWAQECECEVESSIYSITSSLDTTYDPARIALQELMKNKRQRPKPQKYSRSSTLTPLEYDDALDDSKENQSLSFSLSPDNSFDEEEIWVAFDPTTRMPAAPSVAPERVSL